MLFYASLFLFCVAVSAVSLWMYRSLNDIGKAVYRALLPSSKNNQHLHAKERKIAPTTNDTRVPWGWSGTGGNRQPRYEVLPAKSKHTGPTPWGWPGNRRQHERRNAHEVWHPVGPLRVMKNARDLLGKGLRGTVRRRVGWPYRAEGFEFTNQKKREQARDMNTGGIVRPWGW